MHERLNYLYQQWLKDRCTAAEHRELMALMNELQDDPFLHELLDKSWSVCSEQEGQGLSAARATSIYHAIIKTPQKDRSFSFWKIGPAAAILLIACSIFYFSRVRVGVKANNREIAAIADVQPGSSKAILTLANGKRIALDQAHIGMQLEQSNLQINKSDTGSVSFSLSNADTLVNQDESIWNTVATPKGGFFTVTLPDGSRVSLNASSSLSFPSNFQHKREVKIVGEAYFEVAKSEGVNGVDYRPFTVSVGSQKVEVLGTKFNVSAYAETNTIVTTLLTGSVKLTARKTPQPAHTVILKPGEQAVLNESDQKIKVAQADMEEAMAWKDGYFLFNNQSIKEIMDNIARWYDVEVDYQGNVQSVRILGIYDRSKSLKTLLKDLERTGKVHFDLAWNEGNDKRRRVMVIVK